MSTEFEILFISSELRIISIEYYTIRLKKTEQIYAQK